MGEQDVADQQGAFFLLRFDTNMRRPFSYSLRNPRRTLVVVGREDDLACRFPSKVGVFSGHAAGVGAFPQLSNGCDSIMYAISYFGHLLTKENDYRSRYCHPNLIRIPQAAPFHTRGRALCVDTRATSTQFSHRCASRPNPRDLPSTTAREAHRVYLRK